MSAEPTVAPADAETRPNVYARNQPELRELQQHFDAHFAGHDVLDVGCGKVLAVDLGSEVHVVGMDVSPAAMADNHNVDEAFVGDVQRDRLPPAAFDAVLCWDVLEHLDDPAAALANMTTALRPGGLLVLGTPHLWSAKALLTKATPHAFHVWAYRRLLGYPEAGRPGRAPFPAPLRLVLAPGRLGRLLGAQGLELIHRRLYGSDVTDRLPRAVAGPLDVAMEAVERLSRGRVDPALSEALYLFRKPA